MVEKGLNWIQTGKRRCGKTERPLQWRRGYKWGEEVWQSVESKSNYQWDERIGEAQAGVRLPSIAKIFGAGSIRPGNKIRVICRIYTPGQ